MSCLVGLISVIEPIMPVSSHWSAINVPVASQKAVSLSFGRQPALRMSLWPGAPALCFYEGTIKLHSRIAAE